MLISNGEPMAIAPQALAETTPYLSTGYWYGDDGLDLLQQHAAYSTIYRKQLWVASAVDKLANATARLSLRVWDTSSPKGKRLDTGSDYARLLQNPCPYMSPFNFWQWIVSILNIYGESYALKIRDDDGVVRQLVPMHPTRTAVRRDEEGNLIYIFTVGVASAGIIKVSESEVVAWKMFNADNVMRGLSPLMALNQTLLSEDALRRAEESWWKRGARPALALTTDKKLGADAMIRLRNKWDALHAGADKFGGTVVLEEGMSAMPLQLNAEEMAYIETRKINREEVCGRYDIPPPVLQILDNATFSNITEQMRSMYRDTMAPKLEFLESVLDFALRPEFEPDPTLRATFSLDEVTRGDFETRATAVAMLASNAVMTHDEARGYFDLPAMGGSATKLYINGGFAPLDAVPLSAPPTGQPAQPALPAAPPPDLIPRVSAQQPMNPAPAPSQPPSTPLDKPVGQLSMRSLMGRLGRAMKAQDQGALRDKVIAEHKAALVANFEGMRKAALGHPGMKAAQAVGAPDGEPTTTVTDPTLEAAGPPPTVPDPQDFNDQFATALMTLGTAAAVAAGTVVAAKLAAANVPGKYDAATLLPWIQRNSQKSAPRINGYVADKVQAAIDNGGDRSSIADQRAAVDGVFDWATTSYTDQVALSRATSAMALGGMDAARKNGATHKVWNTGEDPRASHAEMDGERVPLDQNFSNGMSGPGDPVGGPAETANCNCNLTFAKDEAI